MLVQSVFNVSFPCPQIFLTFQCTFSILHNFCTCIGSNLCIKYAISRLEFHAWNFFGESPIMYINFDPCVVRSRLVLSRLIPFCYVLLCLV
jgi:hypothetical protein